MRSNDLAKQQVVSSSTCLALAAGATGTEGVLKAFRND